MRVGIVGSLAAFRYSNLNNQTKVGQADLIIHGDHRYPTVVTIIKVYDQALCNFLVEQLQQRRNPIIAFTCWQTYLNKEVDNLAIDIVSVADEPLLEDQEEQQEVAADG